jgi:hypothetical protein
MRVRLVPIALAMAMSACAQTPTDLSLLTDAEKASYTPDVQDRLAALKTDLRETENNYGPGGIRTAAALVRLADYYVEISGDAGMHSAQALYRRALAIYDAHPGPRDSKMIGTLRKMAALPDGTTDIERRGDSTRAR